MSSINAEYKKWYDRFTNKIATKEKHIDILLEKGIITQKEYDSILNQTGYVEREEGEEPVKIPNKMEILSEEVKSIKTTSSNANVVNSLLLLQVAKTEEQKKELKESLMRIQETNSLLLLQIAKMTSEKEVH